ncbi:MAG TPA: NAD(P)/FAD-dependent oxidoreductase [Ktedonobacteraceae bacterium]|nr:NAD(P)/FAD-dependent oxidoreductase [Ktedonobacteraceae bacterium]
MKDIPETGTKTAHQQSDTLQSVEVARESLHDLMPRVVVVGAGFGGLNAAKALADAPVRVTVIDRNNHHLFQPLLYQVATAVLSPADISAPIRNVLQKQKNTEVLMGEVTGVDVENQRVLMKDQTLPEVPYDYLILATGAHDSYFGHNEWSQFAPGLKSITQATTIRRRILLAFEMAEKERDPEKRRALLTFVMVGAGPTGVEMAGAIGGLAHKTLVSDFRHINPKEAHIVLVEALPRILPAFDEGLANKARKALNRLGIEVRVSSPVEAIDSEGVVVAGERIPAKTVIWTAGVAASPAGRWVGTETDRAGRAKVGSDLSVPGHPNIFVIGDTSSFTQDGKPVPGVAPAAIQEGQYVAALIADKAAGKVHTRTFHYVDKGNMAVIGRFYGIVSLGKMRLAGVVAWFLWLLLHLMFLIGFRNRLVVAFQWLVYFTTFRRGARLITFEDLSHQH